MPIEMNGSVNGPEPASISDRPARNRRKDVSAALTAAESLGDNIRKQTQDLTRSMREFGRRLDRLYRDDDRGPERAAEEFLTGIHGIRDAYKVCLKGQDLDAGSSADAMLEWLFYHIIREGIRARKDSAGLRTVGNNHKIHFSRRPEERERGQHKSKRVDIGVWAGDHEELLYCIEIKTNLEDGLFDYCRPREYRSLHRPENAHPGFKYYFVALCDHDKIWQNRKHRKKIDHFNYRREIFLFERGSEQDPAVLKDAWRFLKSIYEPLGA